MKFSIKDFFSKCDQVRGFHFLCSGRKCKTNWVVWKVSQIYMKISSFFFLSCSNAKASTLIYWPGSLSWSVTMLLILNIVEECQLNWTLFLQKFMKMFWRKVLERCCHWQGFNVLPEKLHAFHRMKRSRRVIVRFKCWKNSN